jgi:CRISPR-associated protein Csd1
MSLNENSTNIPYTLGRLFAVYEMVQERANPSTNTTIKDKYFSAAASTPAHIFPVLERLCGHHLRKLNAGMQVKYKKQVTELMSILEGSFPVALGLPEQGSFYLGYYHQRQKQFEKKEDK